MKENYRKMGLGESLLRTILYFLYISGTKIVYYLEDDTNIYNYLSKFGFSKSDVNGLYIDIEKFFSQPCRGK